ncbi:MULTISPECIES: ABC transporter permease [Paraburkholderia]|jgi:sulfonate transport system permease protein|uniref:Aliphatic sulfonates transport permease protein SsuC n=1 Tax=Paraburkholderia aspalathi TaxID=1324617 RepID=A0A1I7EK00_9BURK|nr:MULTISPECIES: ABC transporter permease [Paraburkholderia]MBK3819319.1 ABC transporter permease [Paraburkholderia aspalathi]MBK3831142.1 ABC transporter permease [Paraburkholderia aspalathi]MBK3841413.1 ABC transporter permease [Paraburkholderia aspalathi]MBK3860847.1 ABC transporter permease [Paraburkholderia aspalathi]MCX4142765.1 ABC transporter permease [Paraburkholderia aspalathi]
MATDESLGLQHRSHTTDEHARHRAPQAADATRVAPRPRDPLKRWRIAGLILPLAFLAAIEVLVRASVLPAHLVPAPSTIAETLWQLGGERLARHIGASSMRVLAGFGIGSALALLFGGAMGLSRRLDALLDPAFQALRAIPSLAWVPILLLWMGIDEAPKITLVAIGAFFPVQLSVVAGIRGVDRKLIELGEVNRLSPRALFTRILLPASLPQIFTGLRTGLSLAWMFMVAAELIAATRGLGYLLSDGRETGRPDLVFGAILLLALLGKLSDSILKTIEARVLSWRDTADEPSSSRGAR